MGAGDTFRTEAIVSIHRGQHPLPAQPQANEQVENANDQHGEQEEDQRGDQDD